MEGLPLKINDVLGNALISAAREGAVATVRQLLDGGADANFQDENTNALSVASENGHIKVVNTLLGKGVNINAKTKQGRAAIHEAASRGHASVVQLLIQGGVDINASTDTGATALDIAEEMVHLQVVKLLLQSGAGTLFKERLIIAIEFGARFSSVAYYFDELGNKDPCLIVDWPSTPGLKIPWTPSVIEYDVREKYSFKWGSKVDPRSYCKLESIYLLLDPEQPVPLHITAMNTKKELQKLGKSAVEVASDYIGALYKHAFDEITNCYPKDFVEMQQKRFIFTIPAVWSDAAKENLRKAAKLAGMYPITLVREPFATVLYALHYMEEVDFTIGDAFILCDIGEDSTNLAAFEYTEQGLGLNEVVPGTGARCGTLFLNYRFQNFVKDAVGDEKFLELKKTEGFAYALKTFEREVIPSFSSDSSQAWNICFVMGCLEDDPVNNIQADCLRLKHEAVRRIFEPLITSIVQLVAEQVANVRIQRMSENHQKGKEIKAIILTQRYNVQGGTRAFKAALQKANPNIRIIEPPDAYKAVVSGAVLSQLAPELQIKPKVLSSRISDRIAPR